MPGPGCGSAWAGRVGSTSPLVRLQSARTVRCGWLFHKTTRRDVYTHRATRHPGADDVVLVNERSEVTETTIANLAVQLDGIWWTPPLAAGCLPGVERERLLELGRLQERTLSCGDLENAEGVAVLSSLRGWRSAVLV